MPKAMKTPTTITSGTDGSRAPSVPNPKHGRPAPGAVQKDISASAARTADATPSVPDLEHQRKYPMQEIGGDPRRAPPASGVTKGFSDRDAWLIACCRELLELEAENDRLYVPVADALPGDPVIDAWARFNDRTRDRRLELSSRSTSIRDDGRGAPCQGARRMNWPRCGAPSRRRLGKRRGQGHELHPTERMGHQPHAV